MKITVLMLASAALIGLSAGFAYLYFCEDDWCAHFEWQKIRIVNNFDQCANFGFPVMESYPRQCRAGDKHFVEDVRIPME